MNNEPIIIKKRGEDGSKVITIRIKEGLLSEIDAVANATNHSRNELICLLLRHGIDNVEIQ